MLITEVTFLQDDSAELFGFWYYKEKGIPESRDEKRLLPLDYATGRCCQLKVIGTSKQIEEILLSSEWNPSLRDTLIQGPKELVGQCRKYPSIPIEIDRADKPKGITIPMNLVIRAKEDLKSVLQRLRSDSNEITLTIAPGWDLKSEIEAYLKNNSH